MVSIITVSFYCIYNTLVRFGREQKWLDKSAVSLHTMLMCHTYVLAYIHAWILSMYICTYFNSCVYACILMYICACLNSCMQTFLHEYIHLNSCMHTFLHANILTCIHPTYLLSHCTYILTCKHLYMHTFLHTSLHTVRAFLHANILTHIHSYIPPCTLCVHSYMQTFLHANILTCIHFYIPPCTPHPGMHTCCLA